jgi:ferric-dicitrate binding protein FerR (iron transport regulator)
MPETRLTYLLKNYFESKATVEENDELMSLLANAGNDDEIKIVMDRVWEEYLAKNPVFSGEKSKSILAGILKVHSLPAYKKAKQKSWWLYAAAAVILLIGSAVVYQLGFKKTDSPEIVKKDIETPDIAPGGNKAVLTLADNSTIILDNAANGALTQQGNTKVLKLNDGQLAYNTIGKTAEVLYNTITTPRGGQYQLTLSDGSKVWLNAASSLRFPTAFAGDERRVEMTGEAYFEVGRPHKTPPRGKQRFIVDVAGKGEVEVSGTHFNINSYADEATINTTLLEGKVKVTATGSGLPTPDSRLLSPGQQAQLNSKGQVSVNKNVEVQEVVAWKEGLFHFESTDIKTILRQFSRWYDIEVIYEKPAGDEKYFCIVSRNSTLSNVLKSLQANAIKFRIEGKKLYIE